MGLEFLLLATMGTTVTAALVTPPPEPLTEAQPAGQTLEGAQRFLSINLPWNFVVEVPTTSVRVTVARTTAPSAPRPCLTEFRARQSGRNEERAEIPWDSVIEVSHSEGSSEVRVRPFRRKADIWHFDFNSSALAARAAYAMEFLRQNCDPSASTGF